MAAERANIPGAVGRTDGDSCRGHYVWEAAKHGFARLLGCGDPKQTRAVERQLSETHNQLIKAKSADLEQIRAALVEQWAGG